MYRNTEEVEHMRAMVLVTTKALKATDFSKSGVPCLEVSTLLLYPPGMVKLAAKVTVAISVATIKWVSPTFFRFSASNFFFSIRSAWILLSSNNSFFAFFHFVMLSGGSIVVTIFLPLPIFHLGLMKSRSFSCDIVREN